MQLAARCTTGIAELDDLLGGGLVPGTLTVVLGATGIGKTQLGLQFAQAGIEHEGRPGILFDMTCRGDSQSHVDYAERMFGWKMTQLDAHRAAPLDRVFDKDFELGQYLHVFDYHGRRVSRGEMDSEDWRLWQKELVGRLAVSIAFFYGNFVRGTKRAVIDGLEPSVVTADSVQIQLFEYIYHQILRKDPDWVARDLFRQEFRKNAEQVAAHPYDNTNITCMLLYTTSEVMLDEMISRPIEEGDLLSGANTIIQMGKIRDGNKLGRALYIAKHRGSACSEDIIPYKIGDQGISLST